MGSVDDGVRQAVFAVEVFGLMAQCVDFSDKVAPVVVMSFPDGPVRVGDLFDQCGLVVMPIARGSAQRVGLCGEARQLVVLKAQLVAVGQCQAGDVAGVVQRDVVVLATEVGAGYHAAILVVGHFGMAAQYIRHPRLMRHQIVIEMEVLAVAGPVFDHPRFVADNFPAILASKPQCVGVSVHQPVGVTEVAY